MGFFNKGVELIIPPEKQNTINKTIKMKSLNGDDAIREKVNENNTMTVKSPVVNGKSKTKSKYGFVIKLNVFLFYYCVYIYIYILNYGSP